MVLQPNADISKISQINKIGTFHVKIEKMKRSTVIQCKRCQRFNHTANQCSFNYRCVQCIAKHPPGECPRGRNSDLPLGCINCFSNKLKHAGHTANNLEACQYYSNIVNKNKTGGTSGETAMETSNQPKRRSQSKTFSKRNDISEPVLANNPGSTKKKIKGATRNYRPGTNVNFGKSIPNNIKASDKKTNVSSSNDQNASNKFNALVAALMSTLAQFS